MLNYAGNLFNGKTNNDIGSGLTFLSDDMVIRGKKLIDANTAYRGQVRIGFGSHKNTVLVDDVTSTSTPQAQVDDVEKIGYMNIDLGVGMEKRVGSTRVVGVYGAMFNVGFGSGKTTYEYGNSLTSTNPTATNTFGQGAGVTEVKNGGTFRIGLNAFAGIEWFCAPKISLSGEYTWGLAMSSTGHSSTTSERFVNNSVTSTSVDGGTKQSDFRIDTGVSGATMLGINFYFQ